MRGRVLVTRPEPGASRTARRLADQGYEPVVLPLTEIRPLPVEHIPGAATVDAVAITSANAIRHAPPHLISALSQKPVFAVGGETARAARNGGFATVFEGPGNAEGLAAEMARLEPGSQVLYLCGRIRREGFEAALRSAGFGVDAVETYDTIVLSHATNFVMSTLGSVPVEAALVLSAVAGVALSMLTERADLRQLFENTRYFCISRRAAAALETRHRGGIHVAATPNEDALISLLERES
jgi:uroporphyrinogen-III synthase